MNTSLTTPQANARDRTHPSLKTDLVLAGIPALGLVAAYAFSSDHPARLFRADLTGLVLAISLGAFALRSARGTLIPVGLGLLALAVAHVAIGGAISGALVLAALALTCAAAAAGIALLLEGLRAPRGVAAVVGWSVLCVCMTTLFWADDAAARRTTPDERFSLREALLSFDPATACAYGASGYDRMHDADVYRTVRLAAEPHRPPTGYPTALRWGAIALLCGGLGLVLRRRPEPDEQ